MVSILTVFLAKLVSITGVISLGLGALFYTSAFLKGSNAIQTKQFVGLLLADAVLGFHGTMLYTYTGFLIVSLMGLASVNMKATNKVFMSIASVLAFYLVTNTGFALVNGISISGALIAGIPFIREQLVGMVVASVAYSLYVHKTKKTVLEIPAYSLL